jgi:hypothetical protein
MKVIGRVKERALGTTIVLETPISLSALLRMRVAGDTIEINLSAEAWRALSEHAETTDEPRVLVARLVLMERGELEPVEERLEAEEPTAADHLAAPSVEA